MASSTKARKPTRQQIISTAKKVREKLSNKEHWGKGADARDKDNVIVDLHADTAVKFCLQGAALIVTNSHSVAEAFLAAVGQTVNPKVLRNNKDESEESKAMLFMDEAVTFNDRSTTTHRMVLGAIDRTVNRLSK